jgi:hypothetical protein
MTAFLRIISTICSWPGEFNHLFQFGPNHPVSFFILSRLYCEMETPSTESKLESTIAFLAYTQSMNHLVASPSSVASNSIIL